MHKAILPVVVTVAHIEPSCLIISAIRSRSNFSPFAIVAPRHPGFEVPFAVCGSTEVASARIDNAEWHAEAREYFFLDGAKLFVDAARVLRQAVDEHFDFGELVHAV